MCLHRTVLTFANEIGRMRSHPGGPMNRVRAVGVAVCFALLISACGGGGGSSTPTTPTPSATPNVTATFSTITGDRQTGGGFVYRVTVQVRESAGVAATISGIDLVFLNGTTAFGSTHFDSPMSGDNNQLPAKGTLTSKTLVSTDDDSSDPFATTVRATVRYTDPRGTAATALVNGDIPALPPAPPPPPAAFNICGAIKEDTGSTLVSGATVVVKDTSNLTTSDSIGAYCLTVLKTGKVTIRASKAGYDIAEIDVNVTGNMTANVSMHRQGSGSPNPTPTPSPAPTPAPPGCCKVCTTGKACGNSCISKDFTCNVGPGCACNGAAVDSNSALPWLNYTPAPAFTAASPITAVRRE
jgi:hypothetical protein